MRGQVREHDNLLLRLVRWVYAPVLRLALRLRYLVVLLALATCVGAALLFGRLGQEFVPTLDELDIAIEILRIPSTGLTQSTHMQLQVEKTLGAFPEVALVFSKTGTAEAAMDPVPPNSADAFVILKPRHQWPAPGEPKSALVRRMETALARLPGNTYEFMQPIQMRFNELLAGGAQRRGRQGIWR
jgi:cobalt-zinc-cadmium resistance protein CzcA